MTRSEMERRSAAFAVAIFKFCAGVRKQPGGLNPANQLQDAASSAAANYRAAGRGRSHAEFTAKLGLANEEADEVVYWLEHIAQTELASGTHVERLTEEAKELRAIIAASHATAKRNKGKKKRRAPPPPAPPPPPLRNP